MAEITVKAKIDNVNAVTEFVNGVLEDAGCSMKAQMQIDVAIDELFSNIAFYAYAPGEGDATVGVEIRDNSAVITFSDCGIPYNPLEKDDPDTSLSADERDIGGLGLFIVKKTMDSMAYENRDGKNILTIVKSLR